jgi:hypothetical protein
MVVLVDCSTAVSFGFSFGCVKFLAGPALSGRFCTGLYRDLVLVLRDVALLMDSCVIKPAPLLALQPGCLHWVPAFPGMGLQRLHQEGVNCLGFRAATRVDLGKTWVILCWNTGVLWKMTFHWEGWGPSWFIQSVRGSGLLLLVKRDSPVASG